MANRSMQVCIQTVVITTTHDYKLIPADGKKVDIKSATMMPRRPNKEDITLRRQQSMERYV